MPFLNSITNNTTLLLSMCLKLIPTTLSTTLSNSTNRFNLATVLAHPDQPVNPVKLDSPDKTDTPDRPDKTVPMDKATEADNSKRLALQNAQWDPLAQLDPPDQPVNQDSPVWLDQAPMDSPAVPDLKVLLAHLDKPEPLAKPVSLAPPDRPPPNPDPKDPPAQLVLLASPETMVPLANPALDLKDPPALLEMLEHQVAQETQEPLAVPDKMDNLVAAEVATIARRHEHRLATNLYRCSDSVWRSHESAICSGSIFVVPSVKQTILSFLNNLLSSSRTIIFPWLFDRLGTLVD
jgi:hypothetical protein